ncbi:hypothetical protein BX600DRAFT_444453 [Xylariales sp. PMI_506]|nr:hypothetical protein BX600DRAFT_444453 [Xylariales sp. PMI_506]
MPPPPPPSKPGRKRKAPTLKEKDWLPYKPILKELHRELELKHIIQRMSADHGFDATERQFRKRFSDWGWDKKVKTNEMKHIVRRHQRRKLNEKQKPELRYKVRDKVVPNGDIQRFMKRNDLPPDELYSPSSIADTPGDVDIYTASEASSVAAATPTNENDFPQVPGNISRAGSLQPVPPSPALSDTSISDANFLRPSRFVGQSPLVTSENLNPISFGQTSPLPLPPPPPIQFRYRLQDETNLRQRISTIDLIHGRDHPDVFSELVQLSQILLEQGRYRSAEDAIRRATAGLKDCHGDYHIATAEAYKQLGHILSEQADILNATKVLTKSLGLLLALVGRAHPTSLDNIVKLAIVKRRQNRFVEAEADLLYVLQVHPEVVALESIKDRAALELADVYRMTGLRDKEIQPLVQRFLYSNTQPGDPNFIHIACAMAFMAECKSNQGDLEEALRWHENAVKFGSHNLGPEHPHTLFVMECLGSHLANNGEYTKASDILTQAYEISQKVLGPHHRRTYDSLYWLALVDYYQSKYDKSEVGFRRVITNYSKMAAPNVYYEAMYERADCLDRLGRVGEALDLLATCAESMLQTPEPDRTLLRKVNNFRQKLSRRVEAIS